jgi:hypothetical protein
MTSGSAFNSVSIQFINPVTPRLEGSGAGRTPSSFKDFSYSVNKAFNLSTISEILL